jgi:hypothetical protein
MAGALSSPPHRCADKARTVCPGRKGRTGALFGERHLNIRPNRPAKWRERLERETVRQADLLGNLATPRGASRDPRGDAVQLGISHDDHLVPFSADRAVETAKLLRRKVADLLRAV